MSPRTSYVVGAFAATVVASTALRVRALDRGGALAAAIVGTATFGALGLPGSAVLLAFFTTSVALSRVGRARKRDVLVDVAKTHARDAGQVVANGGVAALCAIFATAGDRRFRVAFAGAFAAAAADTWGTEIGTLVRGRPRSILTLRPVATGLSGGVTLAGTLAEIAGALTVAFAARALVPQATRAVALAGIAGALADSVLGASAQSLRYCTICMRDTERDPHDCGTPTVPRRGFAWVGNDAVNIAATVTGACVGYALAPPQRA